MKKLIALCFIVQAMFVFCPSVRARETITKSTVERYYPKFLPYAQEQVDGVKILQKMGLWLAANAVWIKGYDGFSFECVVSSYSSINRFSKDRQYLNKIAASLPEQYADHIDRIVQRYFSETRNGKRDVNSLSHIIHEETVKQVAKEGLLPPNIKIEELYSNHEKYRQAMRLIAREKQDILVLAGINAKFFAEEVRK